jgi:hypothetical protein
MLVEFHSQKYKKGLKKGVIAVFIFLLKSKFSLRQRIRDKGMIAIKEILDDAIFLYKSGRSKSSLLLLLCLVDAIAKKHYPQLRVGKRYCKYLKERFMKMRLNIGCTIKEKGKVVYLDEIIYEYFRCSLIHEADDRTNRNYEVQIEYDNPGRFSFNSLILWDSPNHKFIVKADNLIEILFEVIKTDLFF